MLLTFILCVPLLAGLLCLFAQPRRLVEMLNLAAFGSGLIFALMLFRSVAASPGSARVEWGEFLRADALSAWMVLLISAVSLATSLYGVSYFRRDLADAAVSERRWREFYVLTPLFATGMLLVVLANNLGVMWIAVEATALSSVLLVALYNRQTSLEAAWKYVMLGGLGLVLALFGTILTYAAAIVQPRHEMASFNWSSLLAIAPHMDHRLMTLAFIFVLVGYGTKAGLAPMHTWLPDAHSEAPSPTSAMLSGVSLKVALYALLRFHILTSACLGADLSCALLLGFGLVLHAPGRAVYSDAKEPQADAGLLQPGTRRPDLRGGGDEHAAHRLRRAAAHGLPRADQAGPVLRGGQHPSAISQPGFPAHRLRTVALPCPRPPSCWAWLRWPCAASRPSAFSSAS